MITYNSVKLISVILIQKVVVAIQKISGTNSCSVCTPHYPWVYVFTVMSLVEKYWYIVYCSPTRRYARDWNLLYVYHRLCNCTHAQMQLITRSNNFSYCVVPFTPVVGHHFSNLSPHCPLLHYKYSRITEYLICVRHLAAKHFTYWISLCEKMTRKNPQLTKITTQMQYGIKCNL